MLFLQQIYKNFLDFLYPFSKVCPICRQNPKAGEYFCKTCGKELEKWQNSRAGYRIFSIGKIGNNTKVSYQALYAAAPYSGAFKQVIQSLKYGKRTYLAVILGGIMAAYFQACTKTHFDMIVPVPLAPRREAQRGFNQSRLLAEIVSQKLEIPLAKGLLLKKKETKTQTQLKRDKRLENLKGVFLVTRRLAGSPNILLVDDIITTGATVREATLALYKAGAGRVEALVWARSIGT